MLFLKPFISGKETNAILTIYEFYDVWPSLLKGEVGGFVRNFAMDIFLSHPIPLTHPKTPIARGG